MKRVPSERWRAAQDWELDLWRREARATVRARLRGALSSLGLSSLARSLLGEGDDWNRWWQVHFENYSFVPPHVDRAVELGCGPFTNMRLMRPGRTFGSICCSDPLAGEYVRLRGTWLAEAYRQGIVAIDDHPAEEVPFPDDHFDLTVMINVLDHVRDLDMCVQNAIRITRPGGIFVLGQDLTDKADIERVGDDLGHPIRVDHRHLDELVSTAFVPIMRKILDRHEGRNPEAHYGTYIFAGTKGGSQGST